MNPSLPCIGGCPVATRSGRSQPSLSGWNQQNAFVYNVACTVICNNSYVKLQQLPCGSDSDVMVMTSAQPLYSIIGPNAAPSKGGFYLKKKRGGGGFYKCV